MLHPDAADAVADGYQLKLTDPYNRPTLSVRRPGSDREELHTFYDDDPFLSELATFIDAAIGEELAGPVLSSYADAVKTYEMTWAIRWASERTRRPKPVSSAPHAPALPVPEVADVSAAIAPPVAPTAPEPVAAAA